jgi:hypothetical protein
MRTLLLWLAIALTGCGADSRPVAYTLAPEGGPVPAAVPRLHDATLAVLGVPPLRTHAVPDGIREIRLSRGHGMIAGHEYPLLRLVEAPDGVRGELIRFAVRMADGRVASGPARWRAHTVELRAPVDWTAVLARLDTLGIDSLTPLRYRDFITDAGDLIVEVRRGADYRAYTVNAPGVRADTTAQRANAMAQLVDSLNRLAAGT